MKKYFTLLMLLFLAGCNSFDSQLPYKPGQMPDLPKGPPDFTQGWKDGCETGFAVNGSDIYKAIYHWKRTPEFEKSDKYLKAWKDGYEYCRQYVGAWEKSMGSTETVFPTHSVGGHDPLGDAFTGSTDTFLQQPSAGGFFSSPSTDTFFGGDAADTFFGN